MRGVLARGVRGFEGAAGEADACAGCRYGAVCEEGVKATYPEILSALNAACREPGGQRRLAEAAKVSPAYINIAVNGHRDIPKPVLRALGFRKVVTVSYERIDA